MLHPKFIDGRVFLQTGKVLKPCQVNYLYPKDKPSSRHVAAAPNDVVVVTRNNGVCSTTPKRLTVESTEYASPSSSMSSLSPSASKESDSELENGTVLNKGPVAEAPTNGPQEASSKCAANRLLDVLEHISQDNTTTLNLPLPSDAVTEDAILTPDTSSQSGMQVPADFSILRSVINPPLDNCQSVNFEIHQCHGESQEDIRVTVSHVEGNFTTAADASKNLQEVVDKDAENSSEMRKQQQQQQQHRTSTTESELVKFETDGASRVSSAVPESPTTKLMADSDVFVNAKNHVVDGDGHVVVLWTR